MRIGFLTTSFPRSEHDIAGVFVLGFARALVALGHSVEVLAPEPQEHTQPPSWPGIDVRHVPYLRPRALQRTFYAAGVPDNLARDPLAWLGLAPFSGALASAARSCAPRWDAVFSHWALPCALAAGWAARQRIPHVAVLHSADVHLLSRLPLRARLASAVAASARALWFVSAEQRRRFVELLPSRSVSKSMSRPNLICPMGIDLPADTACVIDRGAIRERYRLKRFSVLSLGRLVAIKGIDTLIRACAGADMTLVVAGDGPERAPLMQLADSLRADVRFVGNVFGADKSELLFAVDAFALPSRQLPNGRSEGLPTALLEALAHALPVVASRMPGIEQLFDSAAETAWLVPAEDPVAWQNALHTVRTNSALQPSAASQRRAIVEPYAWPRVATRALALLEAADH